VSACRTRSRCPYALVAQAMERVRFRRRRRSAHGMPSCVRSRRIMVLQADTRHLLCRPLCGKALCPLFEFQEPSIAALTSRFGARDLFPGPFETGSLKRRPQGCARAVSWKQVPCFGSAARGYLFAGMARSYHTTLLEFTANPQRYF
jgi:hypothetical protein